MVLTPFAGNWQQLGIPGVLAPDRLLIAATIVLVVLRAATGRGEPLPRPRPVHFVLALATLWVVCSALVSHTLFQRAPLLKIVEAYGIFPFLIFYLAPVIYTTRRKRQMLLTALVVLGAYLGLTVVFEMAGVNALVWPKYILNPNYGLHYGQGRGPFADAVANGIGLYVCALAACVAASGWRGRARAAAGVVAGLCLVGTLLTLERSVWTGVAAGTLIDPAHVCPSQALRHTGRRHGCDRGSPSAPAHPRPAGQGLGTRLGPGTRSGIGRTSPWRR